MPKNIYVGVDGIARLVNNIYVGVDGKARKVTKAYIGVDGIARVFFDGGSIPYYAFLYDDGTLVIQDNEIPDANKTLVNTYFPMKKSYSANKTPWNTQVLNIQNVVINSPIEADMSNYFYNAQNLKNIQQENFITTKMINTYYNCINLTGSPVCGNNVVNMYGTYYNCWNLTGSPVCGENVTTMTGTYWNCFNLTGSPVCGNNVVDMQDTYRNCYNLTGSPICGNNVYSMYSTYVNCKNLTGSPVCGPNVTTMECAYVGCSNLTGSPIFGNKVNSIGGTYAFCTNLTGSPICSPNATSMSGSYYSGFMSMTVGTYENCFNLTGSPVCGENVTNMYKTYSNCYNLTGSPACGENVTNMRETYRGCTNLTGSPVCGNKVTDMYDTYMASGVTGSPVCGNNVVYLSGTYSGCSNLIGAPVCGSNVQYMNFAYYSCQNLYGNSYFYSSKVQNVTSCFGNRNTSNRLNIYTLLNSTTMSTLLQNSASSLVGTSITWIDDMAENNRYYNNEYNIYIYPVDNVQEACLINRDCDFEGEIYLSNVKDVKMLLNENKSNKMVYVIKDESLQPIITIESSNTDIVTVSDVTFNNNKLYYNINSTNLEGSSIITIKIEAGNFSLIKTYNIKVYETLPVEYNIETIEGVTYGFELNENEYYESTNRGISGSYSMCKLNIITSKDIHLYLDCINNGESGWDFGILSELNTTLNLDNNEDTSNVFKSFKNLSNTNIQTVDYGIISSGEYYIYIKYKKDGSVDNGNDSLQFKVRIIEE